MSLSVRAVLATLLLVATASGCGTAFSVTSPDLADGKPFPADGYAHAFGCTGANHAPRLSWSGAPKGTKSFAITIHDVDAPIKGGFWHWVAWDIPASASQVRGTLPKGAVQGVNGAGRPGYLGPCPPRGDGWHHYVVDVLALDVPKLGISGSTDPAVARARMERHLVGKAELTALAKRGG